ncbi:MAG: mechanosensitive ion channel family protein, partial [Halieaceae bacterium]|nr:mechanosensitive ion channel family protein [Halieaceae bacterium]
VASIVASVKAMLETHPDIDLERTLMVNFNAFGPSSLDFFVYAFTKTIVWTEYHAVKQDVLLKILDIIDAHGAEIAFPTRTLHMVSPEAEEITT